MRLSLSVQQLQGHRRVASVSARTEKLGKNSKRSPTGDRRGEGECTRLGNSLPIRSRTAPSKNARVQRCSFAKGIFLTVTVCDGFLLHSEVGNSILSRELLKDLSSAGLQVAFPKISRSASCLGGSQDRDRNGTSFKS